MAHITWIAFFLLGGFGFIPHLLELCSARPETVLAWLLSPAVPVAGQMSLVWICVLPSLALVGFPPGVLVAVLLLATRLPALVSFHPDSEEKKYKTDIREEAAVFVLQPANFEMANGDI